MASDTTLHQLLKPMVEKGATDLHVTTQLAAAGPDRRQARPLPYPPLTAAETKQLGYSVLTDAQKHRFEENLELDFSFGVKGLARFRANIFMQRGAVGGRLPADPLRDPRLRASSGLPPVVETPLREAARPGPGHRARPAPASPRRSRR